jgi:hypothetical protein
MSRIVKVYNSDYKIAVQSGGTITLDTGTEIGTTVVTGNLEVKGITTTVESTTVTLQDNILVLNYDPAGNNFNGIPASLQYVSGIEIERGNYPNAEWLFDEQVSWDLGGVSGQGAFYSIVGRGTIGAKKLPINTPGIVAQGNLYVNTGNGVISVTNTNNYEEKIWNYSGTGGVIVADPNGEVIIDDDNVPNAKAVKDYVDYVFSNQFYSVISQGNSSVQVIDQTHKLANIVSINVGATTTIRTEGQHGFTTADAIDIFGVVSGDALENLNDTAIQITEIVSATAFKVNIDTTGGNVSNYVTDSGTVRKTGFEPSRIKISVEGINNTNLYYDRFETQDIRIQDATISTTSSNQDLILSAPGTGTVKIQDVLEIPSGPYELNSIPPISPASGIKIYSQPQGTGATGLYYVNSNSRSDEIISKNSSLLFSMLF